MSKPLFTPYIPNCRISKAIIAGNASKEILISLSILGISPLTTEPIDSLLPSLSMHPDMQLVNIFEDVFVYAPGISEKLLESLKNEGFTLIPGHTRLRSNYPYDIAYNCAIVGKYAFLNLRYTDPKLLEMLKKCNIKMIPVKQGYAKCSAAILNSEAIITADPVIHKKALAENIDSLLVPPQKNIILEGFNYGFIGGSSGLISGHELAFFGNFETLDSAGEIKKFMTKHGVNPISLSDENIKDLGSLIPLSSV
jgi:hypothetical protein